jgi:hypothetical protein
VPTEFRLRFSLSEVMYWAARYAYADDAEVEAIGDRARERGWYTRDEFLTVARWKSPRSRRLCEENHESDVKAATQLALSTPDERQRIETLTQLRGVGFPTASVLLHLAHRDPYPIIDFRALWSLGVESPPAAYSLAFWWAYTQACRSLAKEAGVRMRTFDRAMWQFSKARQAPSSKKVAAPPAETGSATLDPGHKDHGAASTSGVPGPRTPTEGTYMPGTRRYPYRADIHARLIETAMNGRTITYSGLGTGRRMVGSYLYRIAKEEQAAGRPPLTALVVHKVDGKPGPGFLEAATWVGFWREGETEDEVWHRAVDAVHEYWRPKLRDDLA